MSKNKRDLIRREELHKALCCLRDEIAKISTGGDVTITTNQVGYGSASNLLTSDMNFLRVKDESFYVAGITNISSLSVVKSFGNAVDLGMGTPLAGIVDSLNDGTDDWAFNSVLDAATFGASGYFIFNGYNNDNTGAQAGMLVSSDGSLLGQSGPKTDIVATDDLTYTASLGLSSDKTELKYSDGLGDTARINLENGLTLFRTSNVATGAESWIFENDNGDPMFSISDDGDVKINDAYTLPKTDGIANYVLVANPLGGTGAADWVDPATLFSPTTQIETPITGGTVLSLSGRNHLLYLNPAGALSTLTVNLPDSSKDGDKITIFPKEAVTSVTIGTMGGTTIGGLVVSEFIANTPVKFRFVASLPTWLRII